MAEGLPELCFSILKTTGQLICIKRGESGYYLSDWDTGDKERNVELADEMKNVRATIKQMAEECPMLYDTDRSMGELAINSSDLGLEEE